MRRQSIALLSAAALVAAPIVGLASSAAQAAPQSATVAKGLITPLSLAVKPNGVAYVSQNFAGMISKVKPGKAPKVILQQKGELGAVSVKHGVLTFAQTKPNGQTSVKQMAKDGTVSVLADIDAFETANNPDADVEYGVPDITEECAAEWPVEEFGPATYTGIVESHPYATVKSNGVVYLADAAANAIFSITSDGTVDTLAVLPPAQFEITAPLAEAAGLPECVVGLDYFAESVPTDVEVTSNGTLLVTTLGGGAGEMLPLGTLTSLDPDTGDITDSIGGFSAPVGVAVTSTGDAYVSQLFAGSIVKVPSGSDTPEAYRDVVMPAALEVTDGYLWATKEVLAEEPPFGKLVRWAL